MARKKVFMTGIDKMCKVWAETHFGKEEIAKLTDEQIIEARCESYKMMSDYGYRNGITSDPDNTIWKEFLFLYIQHYFLEEVKENG